MTMHMYHECYYLGNTFNYKNSNVIHVCYCNADCGRAIERYILLNFYMPIGAETCGIINLYYS